MANDPFEGLDDFGRPQVHYLDRARERTKTNGQAEPVPDLPHFRLILWADLGKITPEHEWLVKYLLTRGEISMLAGASQAGKSFITLDLAMAICRAIPFLGHKVMRRGGVVYQAGEGYLGLRDLRIPAYRARHGLDDADDLSFALIGSPIDLFSDEADTDWMIHDIRYAASKFSAPHDLTIIDTMAAATPGADEIAGKDMSKVLKRCDKIRAETSAAVMLVHHLNVSGERERGHTSIRANIDTLLTCRELPDMHDADGRKLRELELTKQKDGESGRRLRFVLARQVVRQDEDGDPIDSCIVELPATSFGTAVERPSPKGLKMSPQAKIMLECIELAVMRYPEPVPDDCSDLPAGMGGTLDPHVRRLFFARLGDGGKEDHEARLARVRKAWERHSDWLAANGLIVRHKRFVWRTKKGLVGSIWDPDREDVTAVVTGFTPAEETSRDLPF